MTMEVQFLQKLRSHPTWEASARPLSVRVAVSSCPKSSSSQRFKRSGGGWGGGMLATAGRVPLERFTPLRRRQTGRWSRRPALPNPPEPVGGERRRSSSAVCFKAKSTCSAESFSSSALCLYLGMHPAQNPHNALHLLSSVASHSLCPLPPSTPPFESLSSPADLLLRLGFFLSECRVPSELLLICVFFPLLLIRLLLLLLPCSSGC